MRESYQDALAFNNSGSNGGSKDLPPFFNLKDGESAIVRILVDSLADIAPYTFHEVKTQDGKPKKIGCIRSLRDDLSKCPMCAAGVSVDTVSYIHLIQYIRNSDGTWKPEPRIWGKKPSESDKSIIGMITKALKVFGPLSNYVTMISRTGEGLKTTYSLNVNIPAGGVYSSPADVPLDRTLFDGFTEDGIYIKNWSADDMTTYLTTGEFPRRGEQQDVTQAPSWSQPVSRQAYQSSIPDDVNGSDLPFNDAPQHFGAATEVPTGDIPFGRPTTSYQQPTQSVARPNRYQ